MAGMFAISACNQSNTANNSGRADSVIKPIEENSQAFKDEHTAENSLDYLGVYKGILPCADCEGIETTITLNKDNTFHIKTTYLGNKGGTFEENGTFKIKGNILTLEGIKDSSNQYFVGENHLKYLDMDGNIITGSLADHYILRKEM